MPLKNDEFPPYCANHTEEKMVKMRSRPEAESHNLLPEATIDEESDGTQFVYGSGGIVVNCFTCLICGYSELYATKEEVEFAKKMQRP